MALRGRLTLNRQLREAVMRGIVRATEGVREEAISLILNTPKTGRVYRRHSVTHQASAPGEPPASNTGRLVQSLTTSYDHQNLTGTVRTNVRYGLMLEYGTQNMEPRPFLRPAVANRRARTAAIIQEEIAKALK